MKPDTAGVAILCVAVALLISMILSFGIIIGKERGYLEVASGKVVCNLVVNSDKTTSWDCKKIVKGE
jgi:hypothetical protein